MTIATRGAATITIGSASSPRVLTVSSFRVGAAVRADNPMRVAALLARPFASERLPDRQLGTLTQSRHDAAHLKPEKRRAIRNVLALGDRI